MTTLKEIPLTDLVLSKNNPRKRFDPQKLAELTESIKQKGVIEPIIVRSVNGMYEVVCGERRLKAGKNAGLETMPAIIKELSDGQALEFQVIENLQREDLNPIDEALGFKAMLEKCKYTQEDLSSRIGKSQPYIANRLRLLSLPADIQQAISQEIITPGHGVVLLRLEDPKEQKNLFQKITAHKLSVRAAENELEQYGRLLSAAPFDKTECAMCPFNGNRQLDLFDRQTKLKDRCLNAGCFAKKMNQYVVRESARLRKTGKRVVALNKLSASSEWRGATHIDKYDRERLGKHYEQKCKSKEGCPHLVYVISKAGSYDDNKDVQKIEEYCLNSRCMNEIRNAATSGTISPVDRKAALKRLAGLQAEEARRRFWKEKINANMTPRILAAVKLENLLYHLGFRRYDLLPKEVVRVVRTGYGGSYKETSVRLLYGLGEKKLVEISRVVAGELVKMRVNDDDLLFLCAEAGFKVERDYVIDRAFLRPKVKEQLVALAKEIGLDKYLKAKKICEPGELIDRKKRELIDFFLKKGFKLEGKIPKEIKGPKGGKNV